MSGDRDNLGWYLSLKVVVSNMGTIHFDNLARSFGITRTSAIWKYLGNVEWSTPAGLKLARENLQSRIEEEDSITNVCENAIFELLESGFSLCSLFRSKRFSRLDHEVLLSSLGGEGPIALCSELDHLEDDMPSRTL
ncbi:hypothetical protein Tco_0191353 [Tanacetum coccineum]